MKVVALPTQWRVPVALVVMTASLTGCSPKFEGSVALTQDQDGDLIALLVPCDGDFNGLFLTRRPLNSDKGYEAVAAWRGEAAGGARVTRVNLTAQEPGSGWTVEESWDGLTEAGFTYGLQAGRFARLGVGGISIEGVGMDSSAPVSDLLGWNAEDIAALQRGQLLSPQSDPEQESDEQFAQQVC